MSRVVDNMTEILWISLYEYDPRLNQRRVAAARYLGELYSYRMTDNHTIYKVCIVVFSHSVCKSNVDFRTTVRRRSTSDEVGKFVWEYERTTIGSLPARFLSLQAWPLPDFAGQPKLSVGSDSSPG